MELTITQFRKDFYALADRALEGETIVFVYKGRRLRFELAPEPEEIDQAAAKPIKMIRGNGASCA